MSNEVRPAPDVAGGSGRYVADWVMDLLPGYVGALDEDVVVDTTIDLDLQAAAARAVAATLDRRTARSSASARARWSPSTRAARSRRWSAGATTARASSTAPSMRTASRARRSSRSSISRRWKRGLGPNTVRIDQPVSIGGWSPENYTREYRGPGDADDGAGAVAEHGGGAARRRRSAPTAWSRPPRRLGISLAAQRHAVDRARHVGGDARSS